MLFGDITRLRDYETEKYSVKYRTNLFSINLIVTEGIFTCFNLQNKQKKKTKCWMNFLLSFSILLFSLWIVCFFLSQQHLNREGPENLHLDTQKSFFVCLNHLLFESTNLLFVSTKFVFVSTNNFHYAVIYNFFLGWIIYYFAQESYYLSQRT